MEAGLRPNCGSRRTNPRTRSRHWRIARQRCSPMPIEIGSASVDNACCISRTLARKERGAGAACNFVATARRSLPMPPAYVCLITHNQMIRLAGLGTRLQNCTIMPAENGSTGLFAKRLACTTNLLGSAPLLTALPDCYRAGRRLGLNGLADLLRNQAQKDSCAAVATSQRSWRTWRSTSSPTTSTT